MPKFLDTRGRTKIAIAVCGRCGIKMPYDELRPDPNYPGVMVCADDYDDLDPYRLPARITEDISLEYPRPDFPISGPSPVQQYANQFGFGLSAGGGGVLEATSTAGLAIAAPVTQLNPANVWQPDTQYTQGDQVIQGAPGEAAPNEFAAFPPQPYLVLTCIVPGESASQQPTWPSKTGVVVADGQVVWLCTGVFLNDSTPAPNTASQPTPQDGQLIFDEQIPGNPLIGAVE